MRLSFYMLLGAYLLLQFLFLGYDSQKKVADARLSYDAKATDKTLLSPRFKIDGSSAPLHVIANGMLQTDTYLGLKGTLVNAVTQATVPLTLPLTNYSTAPGGSHQEVMLPAIPAGEYYLRLDPDASATLAAAPVSLSITRGGLFWSNFWMGLILICLWPLWLLIRSAGFEKMRWMESEFDPYKLSDDDDKGGGFLAFSNSDDD